MYCSRLPCITGKKNTSRLIDCFKDGIVVFSNTFRGSASPRPGHRCLPYDTFAVSGKEQLWSVIIDCIVGQVDWRPLAMRNILRVRRYLCLRMCYAGESNSEVRISFKHYVRNPPPMSQICAALLHSISNPIFSFLFFFFYRESRQRQRQGKSKAFSQTSTRCALKWRVDASGERGQTLFAVSLRINVWQRYAWSDPPIGMDYKLCRVT